MDEKLLKKIQEAIDKVSEDFTADEEIIFLDENTTKKYYYDGISQSNKWKKKQTCIVNGCKKKSIQKSHTIQKSGSINRVAENGHVLAIGFNISNGKHEMKPIGINIASTFPGYCSEHERLFEEFENIKDFQKSEHLVLQLYRTVCREIVINENNLKTIKLLLEKYKSFRDKKIGELIRENLAEEILSNPDLKFMDCKFKYQDSRTELVENKIKEIDRYIKNFLYKYHDAILNDLGNKKFQKITYEAISFDRELPVALAGRGNFNIRLKPKSKYKSVEVIMNVIPLEGKTYIFISTLKKYSNELEVYMNQFKNPLQIISLIERWMVHGTDHWFIKPSVWEKIDAKYQGSIIDTMLSEEQNIGDKFDLTIFNDLKNESIKLMEDNYSLLNEPLIDLLNEEKKKLTTVINPI